MLSAIKILVWTVLACAVAYGIADFHTSGRMQCLRSDYERFDLYANGVRLVLVSGASPSVSLAKIPFGPSSIEARSAFLNVTDFMQCSRAEEEARRFSYVEFKSSALTRAVKRWQQAGNPPSGFRKGDLLKDAAILSDDPWVKDSGIWNPEEVQALAPAWVVQSQLNEENFLAFWGDGHLFRGRLPDQYFWVGYK